MHLKTLTLRGFKSFASATTLSLEPGITCVVGPNGSGKSNVVDALAWVMGEQGAKNLRGGQMADVIFAGTTGRAALGRAQVDLVIDNSDAALPIDYSEVTISRTLFRGGGSEYSINGAPARLLDVQELLSDTGMGRQMHVIVGQGQLDAILSSTPEERRGFIEEAAGVLKHRRRKERALKKLADMDANLVRVLDLTNELHRQLKPLARQAKAARKAGLIQARVRDAQARLLADDLVRARERLAAQSDNDEALARRKSAIEDTIGQLRTHIAALESEYAADSPRVEAAAQAWREATAITERLRATMMTAQDRAASYAQPALPPTGEDPDELERRAQEATAEDAELIKEVEAAHAKLNELIDAKRHAEESDTQASKELARVNRLLADYREKTARLSGDVGSARSRLEAARNEEQRAAQAVIAADARAQEAARVYEHAVSESSLPERAEENPAAIAHAQAVAARDAARARLDELLRDESEAQAERARWEARRDTLAEHLTPDDATGTITGKPGFLATVPELLHSEEGWEDALAALLTPFADAAVVDSVDSAVDLVREARASNAGRIRMLLADAGRDTEAQTDESPAPSSPDGKALPAGTRWARTSVTIAPELQHTAHAILDGCVLADSLESATEALKVAGVRLVATREGDLLSSTALTSAGHAHSSVLTLHAQYERARAAARDAGARETQAREKLAEATATLDAAIKTANEALKALREQDAEHARIAQEHARLSSAAQAAIAEAERTRTVAQRAHEQTAWASEHLAQVEARLEENSGEAPAENLDTAQRAADLAAAQAREAREQETAARLELRALEERARQAQSRARTLRQNAAREREERQRYLRAEEGRKQRYAIASAVLVQCEHALEAARSVLERVDAERQAAEAARLEHLEATSQARKNIDALTQELAEVTSAVHRDEVARAEMTLRYEQLREKALAEVKLEEEQLIQEYGPHNLVPELPLDLSSEFPDTAEQAQEDPSAQGKDADAEEPLPTRPYVRSEQEHALAQAQRELERLGRVNPLALEEHAALASRHEFLVTQVQDLKKSKADLLKIIDDVDALVEEAFTSAFEDTAEQFAHTFEVLFPGGEGKLLLTDPDDMLTTGIEIEARPAGKKVKRLSLLSGGERSLAAVAFLVAIFKARPSPFYVMDEVEAALDDVNLSRLLTIFSELRESSQLIIITHQKRTMEIADALYGVTMRDGVTRVISQRLKEAGKD
ncbi:chromosome segregation protein SMC [Schaalia canis]|uniref:Chromosome partition protein Smc n=1 Tax=Schaalia canis TaxID=100469 RepID=A0A3P1SCZ8_9ACTO|nr:chromosome segregation protein SMC [Schaalia canis]RRC95171.1 chromosome segregation protein SMC [Schaalia canis]